MRIVPDSCWICGKEFKENTRYVDAILRLNYKDNSDHRILGRMCLECAKKILPTDDESIEIVSNFEKE